MKSKPLSRLPFAVVFAILGGFGAMLLAQTSPWPFSSRVPLPSQTPAGSSLTIAFWNIQWFPGRQPDASRGEQARQINAVHADISQLNADVIAMEEVRDFTQAGVA